MPDLRSELQKLADLKFDDDGDTMTEPTASNLGVSETFFNIIRDNPGSTRAALVALALKAGIKDSSSSSLVVQFVRRGIVRAQKNGSVSTYTAVGNSYTKGYIPKDKPKKAKPVAKATPKPTPVSDNAKLTTSVPQLLDTLSIVQARELYDALKKIFGA
jgi:hypothetical protein